MIPHPKQCISPCSPNLKFTPAASSAVAPYLTLLLILTVPYNIHIPRMPNFKFQRIFNISFICITHNGRFFPWYSFLHLEDLSVQFHCGAKSDLELWHISWRRFSWQLPFSLVERPLDDQNFLHISLPNQC